MVGNRLRKSYVLSFFINFNYKLPTNIWSEVVNYGQKSGRKIFPDHLISNRQFWSDIVSNQFLTIMSVGGNPLYSSHKS